MTNKPRFPAPWPVTIPDTSRGFLPVVLAAVLALLPAIGVRAQTATTAPAETSVAGAAVSAAAPQSKPLLILRTGGKLIALRARTSTRGASLLIETLDGAAQSLDISVYVNQLAWYTDAEMASGRVDLNALAIRYRAFGGLYPEVQATLYAEAQRFRDIAERLKNSSQQHIAETQKRATDFLALRFDPAKSGTREEVAGLVREADELVRLIPAQAAQITQAAAPIREALAKLDAGQIFYEGRWRPDAEAQTMRKQRSDEAIQQTFDKTLTLPLDPLALSPSQLFKAVGVPVAVLLVLFIAGLVVFFGKRRGLGVLLLAVAVAVGGLGYASLSENNSGGLTIVPPDSPGARQSSSRVVRLLYRASPENSAPLSPEDHDVRLTDADLSGFLARHVQPKEGMDTTGGLRREGLALGINTDGFTVLERVVAAGQTVYLRYDVKLDATGDMPGIKEYSVKAGRVTLPGPIKDWLWAGIGPALGEYVKEHHLIDAYALTDMRRGEMDLSAARPTTATPAMSAEPSPTPEATPVPTPGSTPTPAAFSTVRPSNQGADKSLAMP